MSTTKIRITKKFDFEAAHALYGYDGKCKNLHGHSYKLVVTVIGSPITDKSNPKWGMVMDFGDLKRIVQQEIINKVDHSVMLCSLSPHSELAEQLIKQGHQVVYTPYQPTSENMVIDFAQRLQKHLPEEVTLHSVLLQETENSYAQWFSQDNL